MKEMFRSKTSEVMRGSGKLRNEKLHDLYSSPSTTRIMKSKKMSAGHVARMERRGMHIGYCWESHKERDHYEE
jgi:hypothetical protein